MASTSESGHGKNTANFKKLISFIIGFREAYNPTKPSIRLTAMQALLVLAISAIDQVRTLFSAYKNAVAAREAAFAPISKFITRVLSALKATDTTRQVDESARTFARKIQGIRASARRTEAEKQADAAAGKEVVEISSSQMSFDSRIDYFENLIKLLAGVTLYAPNEEDLKVTALTALCSDLKTKNDAVVTAATQLSNARISRNIILYKPLTGLVDTAMDAKTYIKSVYGATSPQLKQVAKLDFTTVKV
jgi:hypothetical protein